jgi:uncharacterized OB-fold protein
MTSKRGRDTDPLSHSAWADAIRDGTLLGCRCSACGNVAATPKSACPNCSDRTLETIELPRTGTVHSETTIEVTPIGAADGYQVVVVDLGEARVLGRIDGSAEIGTDVTLSGYVEYDGLPGPTFEPTA